MKISYLPLAAMAVIALAGAGCMTTTTVTPNTNDSAAQTDDSANNNDTTVTAKTPVPYSSLTKGLLESKKEYSGYIFTEDNGNCSSLGAPKVFAYEEDPKLGYFVTAGKEGSDYYDKMTMGTGGTVTFDDLTVNEQDASCTAAVSLGKDSSTLTCKNGATELCSGSYTVTAVPR